MNRETMSKGLGILALTFALGLVVETARADVKLPNIFGSHMVLQQGQKDKVWGTADPGEEVTVKIADQTKTAKACEKGKWSVTLGPLPCGGPLTMTVQGKNNAITFDDVLVGEVWVCSGQSNMQMNVGGSNDADLEIKAAKYPQIRLISVPQVGTQEPKDDFNGKWVLCSPETVPGFSAAGYFFGRQLHQTLGVPVGLINDAWGGSACEAWVRRDVLAADPAYKPMMDRWAAMEAQYEKDKADGKDVSKLEGNMRGNARPANIYNGVLLPTIGYGIKGAIWYQGETNAGRSYQYRTLFPLMIKNWRDDWGIGNFSFYWVQLADFMNEKPEPSESGWAELREAQTMTMDKLPNTGEAVIIDVGEANNIHPKNKQAVGMRLARWALAKDYGIDVPCQSPRYKAMAKDGYKLVLAFDHVGPGLKSFDVPEVKGFAIAGADKKFVWAQAKIVGPDKIEVWADGVSEPAAARYGWADNPVINVYSKDGLPLTPFRTDDWPGVTINNN